MSLAAQKRSSIDDFHAATQQQHEYPRKRWRREEGTWSNIPVLLLWMIKDRLPFIENLMVSVVCKHWHYASKIHPTKELQGADCRTMWMIRIDHWDKCWKDGQITNSSTGKKYFVGSPHVDSVNATATVVLCSEKGWLFLATPHYPTEKRNWAQPTSPMFLINLFTKQRYGLPSLTSKPGTNYPFSPNKAAISTINGIPHWVVIGLLTGPYMGNSDLDPLLFILKIAQPNGKEWRTYTYRYGIEENVMADCWPRMLVGNNLVYLIDRWGRTLAFDIIGATWTKIVKQKGELNEYCDPIVQSDGAIIRIILKFGSVDDPKQITRFLFHKLNEDEGKWVNLDHNELIGKCWYLAGRYVNFVTKYMEKTEIYFLDFKPKDGAHYVETYTANMLAGGYVQMVSRHRLDKGLVQDDILWVDLG